MKEKYDRVLSLLGSRGIPVGPKLTETEVARFEQEHRIRLPEDYRWFLLAVGACCVGPPNGGLLPLDILSNHWRIQEGRWPTLPSLSKPFPFTRNRIWGGNKPPLEHLIGEVWSGSLYLGTDGCVQGYHLIVSGPEAGHIWDITQFGASATEPRLTFLDWFERWAAEVTSARVAGLRSSPGGPLGAELRRRGWVLSEPGAPPDRRRD